MVGQLRPVKIESQKLWFSLSTSTAGGPVRFLRIPGTRRAKGNSKDERRGVADDDNDITGLRPPPVCLSFTRNVRRSRNAGPRNPN